MAASIIGSISEFNREQENVVEYIERFESFLEANSITDGAKIRAVFLALVGPVTYKLLRSLAGNKPKEKSYEELKALLIEHLDPKPNIITQRYKFYKRERAATESVSEYVAALRKLSEHCNFGDGLNDHLRDRIVCGINNERILQKLLSIKDLDLKTAIDNAVAIEAAMRNTKEMQVRTGNETHEVHRVEPPKNDSPGKAKCYRCGDHRHMADKCPFKAKECYGCKKTGHIKRMCKASERGRNVNSIVEVEEENVEDALDWLSLYTLESQRRAPIIVNLKLNGRQTAMELDTGAAVSVMSKASYEKISDGCSNLDDTSLRLRTYTGEMVKPLGTANVEVRYQEQKCMLPVTVVESNAPTLLGRDWLSALKLDWNNLFPGAEAQVKKLEDEKKLNSPSTRMKTEVRTPPMNGQEHFKGADERVRKLVSEFPTVFSGELGRFRDFKVNIPVPPDATPRFFKHRQLAYS